MRRLGNEARTELTHRLRARRFEIKRAIMARVYGVADPSEVIDPDYVEGLRAAVSAAIDHGIAGVEHGEGHLPPLPAALLTQARLAARSRISLDIVLRRYFAGFMLFGDFVMEEVREEDIFEGAALKRILRAQTVLFDRLIAAVTDEYTREAQSRLDSVEERRTQKVERLLAGELIDTSELAYQLDASHLGAIVAGPGGSEAIRDVASALGRRILLVRRDEGTIWAWLGGAHSLNPIEIERRVASVWPARVSLALGEPAEGLEGWRLTHRQACAALPIALRSPEPMVRYADVPLLASVLQDDVLSTSLRELYLVPLECDRDGGEIARKTLRAFFAADRNAASAAAALGVSRQAVGGRLRAIERRLAKPLTTCAAELETALLMEQLGEPVIKP